MYRRLYSSWYKSKVYQSRYKGDEGGNDKLLVTVWLKVWLEAKNNVEIDIEINIGII